MKRLIIFSVMLMFLFGAMAYATNTRVETMGMANNIVMDEANISLYPSVINYYPKLFLGEFSGDYYWKAGASFLVGENSRKPFVMGGYFSRVPFTPTIVSTLQSMGVLPPGDASASHRIEFHYGREVNQLPVGFTFSYFNSGEEYDDSALVNDEKSSLSRFEFGLGISPMMKKLDLGAHLAFTTWTNEDYVLAQDAVVDMTKPTGNIMFDFNARYWMPPVGKYVLIPHLGFSYDKQGIELYGDDAGTWTVLETYKTTDLMLDLGLGMNYEAAPDILVIADLGFALDNYKLEYVDELDAANNTDTEDKMFVLPYFRVGLDAKVFNWLDLRSGVHTRWEKMTHEPYTVGLTEFDKYTTSEAVTSTFLGAGFNWGQLYIDAEVNTDFIENGPYFVSGDDTVDLFEQISLKYMF